MSRTVIYLPVEVSRRELISRAFLSCRLANSGHDVLVFASDLFDRFGWPGSGVYIGKNVFRTYVPHDLRFYDAMKAAGIAVWYHDEESGVLPGAGPSDWEWQLDRRADVSILGQDDKVLAWGEFQKVHYERKRLRAPVHLVGSVNFEIYRPEYAPLFADYDREQTGGAEDYILFNTRFATVNGYYTGKGHAINSGLHTDYVSDPERFEGLSQDGILLYHMVGLIAELALNHPEERIFVRPHPIENPDFYRQVFATLPNVALADKGDAGSWIRQARCLVHNGCTTAIQANIAEKPVISFVPSDTQELKAASPLPNEVGAVVATRAEAIEAIFNAGREQAKGSWPIAISNLHTIDAIDELVAVHKRASSLDEKKLRSVGTRSTADFRMRHAAYPLFPAKMKSVRMRERFFDRRFFNRFGELVRIANGHWRAPVTVERVAPECWRVRPA